MRTERLCRRSKRAAIWRVAIAGGLSAGIAGAVEIAMRPEAKAICEWKLGDPVLNLLDYSWQRHARGHSPRNRLYLFRISPCHLSVGRNCRPRLIFPDGEIDTNIAFALARAALELPNPPDSELGVNHLREAPRLQLLLAAVIYKLKIMGSNMLAKVLLRKLTGRAATRVWLEFIAVPITAFWNAIVCWLVLKEVRVRALGPSMSMEFADMLLHDLSGVSLPAQETMLQAVGSIIVRSADPHPNLVYLLKHLSDRLHIVDKVEDLDDPQAFLDKLPLLTSF